MLCKIKFWGGHGRTGGSLLMVSSRCFESLSEIAEKWNCEFFSSSYQVWACCFHIQMSAVGILSTCGSKRASGKAALCRVAQRADSCMDCWARNATSVTTHKSRGMIVHCPWVALWGISNTGLPDMKKCSAGRVLQSKRNLWLKICLGVWLSAGCCRLQKCLKSHVSCGWLVTYRITLSLEETY